MRLVREDEIRDRVSGAFGRQRLRLVGLLSGARIEHIGATAVAGILTKGDLDICVVVPREEFVAATDALGVAYYIHQPENWTKGFASYVGLPDDGIEIGIQLVVAGSSEERTFIGWRERLRADPDLRDRYDRLKREHEDAPMEAYRAAKERLILD